MLRTLLVEDNANYRQILKDSLKDRFPAMMIEEAADGKEALQKVETFLPHLVFMDIQLPGENGLHLTKRIKADHPDTLIIIVTSYDLPEYREAAFQYGASHFIAKDELNLEEIEAFVKTIAET
ncbi:MAG: response regulator [Deltaproteobacteria bacterium]|nr:MAG: response regulator [Deltaproteobacteria bacterium]